MALLNEIPTRNAVPDVRDVVLEHFFKKFPLAMYLHFFPIWGNGDKVRKRGVPFNAGNTRTIGNDYPVNNKRNPDFENIDLKIYGDPVATDIANDRRSGDMAGDEYAQNQRMEDVLDFVDDLALWLMDGVINHSTVIDSEQFNGMKSWAATLGRNRIANGLPNGLEVLSGNANAAAESHDIFLREIDFCLNETGADVIIGNSTFSAWLKQIGRGYVTTTRIPDIFGNDHEVTSYHGIPIIPAGKRLSGPAVIGNNETVGTSTDCTSLYFPKFGTRRDVTAATSTGLDVVDNGRQGTAYETLVELDVDLVVTNPNSLMRLSGLRFR